jgi:hypothetical protein
MPWIALSPSVVEKYESAAKKCKVAEYTSSLSTAESDVERENRRIRCRTFPSEHDSPPAKQKQCRTIPRNVTEHMSNQEFMVPPPAPATLLTFDNCSKSDCGKE